MLSNGSEGYSGKFKINCWICQYFILFSQKIWKQFTIRIIPLWKHSRRDPQGPRLFLVTGAGMENNQFHLFQRIEECRLIFEFGHLDIWGDPKWQLFKSLRWRDWGNYTTYCQEKKKQPAVKQPVVIFSRPNTPNLEPPVRGRAATHSAVSG